MRALVEKRAATRELIDGRLVVTTPGVKHGSISTYGNWKCRCKACRKANTKASDERRRARLARAEAAATCQDKRRCGTVGQWRAGCRNAACRLAHNTETRDRRRTVSLIDDGTWAAILADLRAGTPLVFAAVQHDCTPQAVHKQAQVHLDRGIELDQALLEGRDPALPHGTTRATKTGCGCPDCRDARRRWR